MFVLGVIAARGGSKGLPGKNVRVLGGIPMIGWTIKAAQASSRLSRAIVSTDDAEISRIAKNLGAVVPFARPAALATDKAGIVDVLRHAVDWIEAKEQTPVDVVVLLQATSPLRRAQDIDESVALLEESGCDSVQTVAVDHAHPWHRFLLKPDGRLEPLFPEAEKYGRRQEAPPVYKPTGAVYAARRAVVMDERSLKGRDHRGLVRGEEVSVDVDSLRDFRLAEWYLESGGVR